MNADEIKAEDENDEALRGELRKFCLNQSEIKSIEVVTVRNTRLRFSEANQVAPSFCTQHTSNGSYTQTYRSSVEIIAELRKRGVKIDDEAYAHRYLEKIGYYRIKGYGLSFRLEDSKGDLTENYQEGTRFEDLTELYEFDRRLRALILDGIEHVEVSFRARLNDSMALKHGPHWLMEGSLFNGKLNKKGKLAFDHEAFIKKTSDEARRNKESLPIRHYYKKYGDPNLPPCWMLSDVLSMGSWSKLYGMLSERADQKAVADNFCASPPELTSWIHALTNLRNICAHHNRLWDRKFVICPSKKKNLKSIVDKNDTVYAQVVTLLYCLLTIEPKSEWLSELKGLVHKNSQLKLEKMGFPKDWEDKLKMIGLKH